MTLLEQTERALINADAAGDTPSATVLAGEVRRLCDLSAVEPSVETATAPSGYVLPRLGQAVAAPFMGATAVAKGLANASALDDDRRSVALGLRRARVGGVQRVHLAVFLVVTLPFDSLVIFQQSKIAGA